MRFGLFGACSECAPSFIPALLDGAESGLVFDNPDDDFATPFFIAKVELVSDCCAWFVEDVMVLVEGRVILARGGGISF
jgi:hypothetical protein